MNANERLMKFAAASPQQLAQINAILNGKVASNQLDEDLRLVTYTEAAKRLNVSRPTVYRLVENGRIEAVALNGINRVRLQSVIDYVNNRGYTGGRYGRNQF